MRFSPRLISAVTACLGVVMLAALLAAAPALAAKHDTHLVSRIGLAGAGGGDDSLGSYAVSYDGQLVVFTSSADNLSSEDNDAVRNVYVKNMWTGGLIFVNRATGATGVADDTGSDEPFSISDDGTVVAFQSDGDNLVADDNDTFVNAFARNLITNTTTLVSRATGVAGVAGDGASTGVAASGDGHFIAFASDADNLSTTDDNTSSNIFVRDLIAGTTMLVNINGAGIAGDGAADSPSISSDGRLVAFASTADNLSTVDNNTYSNIFLRDTTAGTTVLVSQSSAGVAGDGDSIRPSISADGRYVAFQSNANSLSPDDTDAVHDIFVRDVLLGTTTLASRADGAAGAAGAVASNQPSISADGRSVAFHSSANNLSALDTDALVDVFVRNLDTNTTTFASRPSGITGAIATGSSSYPGISGNGYLVTWESIDNDLSPDDVDAVIDSFARELISPPRNTVLPQLTGSAIVGKALTCSDGTWVNGVTSYARGWNRNGVPIAGASLGAYTLGLLDIGKQVSCSVTATNADGGVDATTASMRGAVNTVACSQAQNGTGAAETLIGTAGGDRIRGLGGNDSLQGLRGNDCLNGGSGRDQLNGGPGADVLSGGPGRDRLTGRAGNDKLTPGRGRDIVSAGGGRDAIFANDRMVDRIDCGSGRDRARVDRVDIVAANCERVSRV